jgi:hypothetical protein
VRAFHGTTRALLPIRILKTELHQSSFDVRTLKQFAAAFLLGSTILTNSKPSNAQIPSMDEYNTGSGTVLPGRARVVGKPPITAAKSVPETFSVEQMKGVLTLIDAQIASEPPKWDEMIRDIKSVSKVKSKYLGFTSPSDLANNFKISSSQANLAESAREDVAFNVGLLNDLALANKEYFFNKADLEQTQLIKDSADVSSASAVKEAKDIIKDIKTSFASLEENLTSL